MQASLLTKDRRQGHAGKASHSGNSYHLVNGIINTLWSLMQWVMSQYIYNINAKIILYLYMHFSLFYLNFPFLSVCISQNSSSHFVTSCKSYYYYYPLYLFYSEMKPPLSNCFSLSVRWQCQRWDSVLWELKDCMPLKTRVGFGSLKFPI